MKKTPDEIRLARLRIGYSQQNMADELGMSQPNYSKIENGKYENVPPEIWRRMEHIFNVKQKGNSEIAYGKKLTELEGELFFLKKELDSLKEMLFGLIKRGGGG